MATAAQQEAGTTVIAITGATGMIGSALAANLRAEGVRVRRLVRGRVVSPDDIPWAPEKGEIDSSALEGIDAIVNLAGAPIAQRWTEARKLEIRESRVKGTTTLANAVAKLERKPKVVLSGAAIGYYGDRDDELLDETSAPGSDFLSHVVMEWEAATAPMANAGVRVVMLRTGIVLSRRGGALAKLLLPFELGLGGPIGSGKQWMSWISLHDHVRAMRHAIATPAVFGPVNLVAPEAVRNAEFAHTFGRVLNRPSVIPVPAFALELIYGEMAKTTILAGQHVIPRALLANGFSFDDPTLEAGLRRALSPSGV
jgi:uncharacterized protein (TIGR01777 family)